MPSSVAGYRWEISDSPYPSPFLSGTREFGVINPCFLVDQYSGKRPAIFNKDFFEIGKIQFYIYPSALLDSNLANQVYSIVNGGKVNDGFGFLLKFLTEKRWDFNLNFYYIEHFCKAKTVDDFMDNAVARTRALLALHSMDEMEFLDSGRVVPNSKAIQYYLSASHAANLDEVALQRVTEFCEAYSQTNIFNLVEAIESTLIKMFLLRRIEIPKATPLRQHEAFREFLERDLGVMLAREFYLAYHYFYDQAGSLLGIQPNTPINRALATIKSTAWDMLLLRMPELFFSGSPKEMCLPFIATQERQLGRLARLFSVESIVGTSDGRLLPVIDYAMHELPKEARDLLPPLRLRPADQISIPVGLRDAMVNELRRVLPK
jgi:hypothetical protein